MPSYNFLLSDYAFGNGNSPCIGWLARNCRRGETAEQLAMIRDLGANEVQGYVLGRPTSNPIATIISCCDREKQTAA